jgi:hypothetical protein
MRKRGGTKRQIKPTPKADAYKKELSEKSVLKVKKAQEKDAMNNLTDLFGNAKLAGSRRRRTRRRY